MFLKCQIAFNFFLYFLHLIKALIERKTDRTLQIQDLGLKPLWSCPSLASALSIHRGSEMLVDVLGKMRLSTNVVAIIILGIFEGKARKEPYKTGSLCMRPGRTNI